MADLVSDLRKCSERKRLIFKAGMEVEIDLLDRAATEIEALRKRFDYALSLIDAADEDADGMAGIAFFAQVPIALLEDKRPSEIAELLCDTAIAAAQEPSHG